MKKLIIALALFASTAQATEFYTSPAPSGKMMNAVEIVEARIQRRAELQDQSLMAKMKIAAFQVEIAKAELDIATAEAVSRRLDAEAEEMAQAAKEKSIK